jgi:hypothetical protein
MADSDVQFSVPIPALECWHRNEVTHPSGWLSEIAVWEPRRWPAVSEGLQALRQGPGLASFHEERQVPVAALAVQVSAWPERGKPSAVLAKELAASAARLDLAAEWSE